MLTNKLPALLLSFTTLLACNGEVNNKDSKIQKNESEQYEENEFETDSRLDEVGRDIKEAGKDVGEAVKNAADDVEEAVKDENNPNEENIERSRDAEEALREREEERREN